MPHHTGQFLAFALCLLVFPGCGKKASDEIDFGTVNNSVYHNRYFNLKLTLPSEWSVQDQETRQRLTEMGTRMMAGDDKAMKAVLKASELQTVNLLAAFRHPVGTPVPSNPGIACVAERVRGLPGIKRGKDYLFHAKKMMQTGQIKFEFPKEIATEKLGEADFDMMPVLMTVGSTTVQQKYYAAIMKDYALVFVVSFTAEDDKSVLQDILESISFK